ncbi:MAG: patatin-like phospholipase family protein [Geminicoccaceae bacterium]|nr:patatin-like phospholipase family protein [Geminicoccaceae bacterium]
MAKPRPLNLALQGGGAHGAYAWGVLDRLLESAAFEISAVTATSAGAMNAVVLADGLRRGGVPGARDALRAFWRDVSLLGLFVNPVMRLPTFETAQGWSFEPSPAYLFFDAFTRLVSPYRFNPLGFNPLREVLERHVDFAALRRFEGIGLFVNATNVRTGRGRVFHCREVTADAVMASACLPFLFQAVEIEGEAYWDGGYTGNPALWPLFYHTPVHDVLLVLLNPLEREEVPMEAAHINDRLNEISFNASLLAELRAIAFVQKLLGEGMLEEGVRPRYRPIRVHAIRADRVLDDLSVESKLDTSWGFLEGLFERGRGAAEAWLADDGRSVGREGTVDLKAFLERPMRGGGRREAEGTVPPGDKDQAGPVDPAGGAPTRP